LAYASEKSKIGREPVSYVELDFNACSLTYGSAPCTASGSVDGKCFNGYAGCQDKANFSSTTKTLRFSNVRIDDLQGTTEAPTVPSLVGVNLSPTSLTPGQGLGIRATCDITLEDHPSTMVGIDPYISDRTYVHQDRGSFWSKLVTMFPYYVGNEVRVYTGFLEEDGSYDASNFKSRTYFIDSITGPSAKGKVQIKCKDILRFGDREKATIPTLSQCVLASDASAGATSLSVTDPNDDVKDSYDGGQAYIRVDDETMLITNITGSNPSYTLTVTRAAMPSVYTGDMTAEAHDADATVQHCHFFNAEDIDDILYYCLNTGAGIDASYLPTAEWQSIIDFGLQSYSLTTLITEPTGVKELLEELSQHNMFMWWNERTGKVKLDSIIKRATSYGVFDDDDNIIADSVNVSRDDKARVSQVWMAFGHRTPIADLDEYKNFTSIYVSADAGKEGANEYNQKRIKRIFSRWLPLDKRSVATEITNRYLNHYKDTKHLISLELDPKDDDAWTGDFINMKTRLVQNGNGATPERGYRVLEANEILAPGQTKYRYKLQSNGAFFAGASSRYALIGPNTLVDYDSESESNKNKYAFIASGDRGDGEPGFDPDEAAYQIL